MSSESMVQKSCKPENRLLKNDDLAMQYVHCDFDKARCRAHWGEGIRLEGIRESPEVMMVIQFSGTVPLHNSDVVSSGYLQGLANTNQQWHSLADDALGYSRINRTEHTVSPPNPSWQSLLRKQKQGP